MKQDRFLIGILIGIGVLIAIALAVFFTRQDKVEYATEDTPEATVHNYVLALLNKDYGKAYSYLAELDHKPTYEQFFQPFAVGGLNTGRSGIKIGNAEITGDNATVDVSVAYSEGGPFAPASQNMGSARLIRQNGTWKISSLPAYDYWDFGWYQALSK